MSQLIRSLAPLRASSVLITVKELITGLSMDFCCSPSAGEESTSFKYSGRKVQAHKCKECTFLWKSFNRICRLGDCFYLIVVLISENHFRAAAGNSS